MKTESSVALSTLARPVHKTLTRTTAETLRQAIEVGSFPAGSQLPSEKELISRLGISRTTLREALRILEDERLIERRRGLGTYVSERPILKDLSANFSISEMILAAGMTPGVSCAEVRIERASSNVAAGLRITEGTQVVLIDRVRTANDRPVVWSLDFLPPTLLGPHGMERLRAGVQSIYEFLACEQVRIVHGVAELRPILATKEIAGKLEVKRCAPILCITQTDYSANNQPVLYSIEYHLPDTIIFQINRKGPHT
ncbi:MAG: GntR family transcriptional regulator [Chloroflexi bacterium]|nr:GntR family transcriptional regulator [Chloroflexota bacterium]